MTLFKHFLPFVLFFIAIVSASAQDTVSKKGKWHHVDAIQDGIVLIRLRNNDKQVYELKKAGLDEKADLYERERKFMNDAIKSAFKKYYNFSDYYFYYSNDVKFLLKGKTEGIIYDQDGQAVDFELNGKDVYVAEFGYANAPGATERYNKRGFLLRQLQNNEFIRLPTKMFYYGAGSLERKPNVKINTAVYKMNSSFLKQMRRLEAKPDKKEKRLNKAASKY